MHRNILYQLDYYVELIEWVNMSRRAATWGNDHYVLILALTDRRHHIS